MEVRHQRSSKRLYISVFIVNFLHVSTGSVLAWTSPTFPKLNLNNEEQSLVGSLLSLGAAIGPLIIAVGLNRLGRKGTIYAILSCYLISWIVLASSVNIYVLYVGRIIAGIGLGAAFTAVSVFTGEIADNENRGTLGSFNQIFVALGFILQYCLGPYVSYEWLIAASALAGIIFAALFYTIPETPQYLLMKGKRLEAIDSLSWFRGKALPHEIQPEINQIEASIAAHSSGNFALLKERHAQKALMISLYLLILQQGCAFNAIIAFAQNIFELSNITISPAISSMSIGFTNLFASLPTPFIVNKFGMKKTFLASVLGTAIFQGILAIYFYVQPKMENSASIEFVPILCFVFINIFYCCGLGPLPWAFAAEMFSLEVKSIASSLCGVFSSLFGFAVVEGFGFFLYYSGPIVVFAVCSIFLFLGSLGVLFFVPDTRGMTLEEIQDYLKFGKKQTIAKS